ncbi:hypothetical protein HDU98_009303 [Podochytrium sp. JEL0797]|nr:hypothetical protein HDU98_009303 [Podochytrium sp. JEL0797]
MSRTPLRALLEQQALAETEAAAEDENDETVYGQHSPVRHRRRPVQPKQRKVDDSPGLDLAQSPRSPNHARLQQSRQPVNGGREARVANPILTSRGPIYSLPTEILREIVAFLPVDLVLGQVSLTSKFLFGFMLSDIGFASAHMVVQGGIRPIVEEKRLKPVPNAGARHLNIGTNALAFITAAFLKSLPANYQAAMLLRCFSASPDHLSIYNKYGNSSSFWQLIKPGIVDFPHAHAASLMSRIASLDNTKLRTIIQNESVLMEWLLDRTHAEALAAVLPFFKTSSLQTALLPTFCTLPNPEILSMILDHPQRPPDLDFSPLFKRACRDGHEGILGLLLDANNMGPLPFREGMQQVIRLVNSIDVFKLLVRHHKCPAKMPVSDLRPYCFGSLELLFHFLRMEASYEVRDDILRFHARGTPMSSKTFWQVVELLSRDGRFKPSTENSMSSLDGLLRFSMWAVEMRLDTIVEDLEAKLSQKSRMAFREFRPENRRY